MKVTIKKTKRILDSFFKVDHSILQFEKFDGTLSEEVVRLNLERGDSVAVLLVNREKNKIILIKQFRFPVYTKEKNNAWTWEIVAGMVDDGHSPEESIIREIAEETGYHVSKVDHLFYFYPTPGGSNEKVHLYYAEVNKNDKKYSGGGVSAEGEDILAKEFSYTEAFKMMNSGEIIDAKTIIALMWFRAKVRDWY
ncbi:NUDIX hydrolase [candidate division KSB1 bacterium]|nr:NUDIX hydrolase [candidate division KSB1 bacterium]MBL7095591.1 NUDIX hydrolase [candidate division KSB1 bacterium]